MPAPRLLVIEGNTPENRANHVAAGGTVASTGYAALLQELQPSAVVDICFPADPGANPPSGQALEGYDGGAITGSVIVIAKRSIIDIPTVALAIATVLLLWRFKKLQEPVIVAAAALFGLVAYPLIHAHAI